MKDKIVIHADGGCRFNGTDKAIGAYGYFLKLGDYTKEYGSKVYVGKEEATNNKMELMGIIEALKQIKNTNYEIDVHLDSKYVLNGIQSWISQWKKNGWITASKQPVKNVELWKQLDEQVSRFTFSGINFFHVKGHSGDKYNELVDKLCNDSMDKYKK